MTTTFDIPTTSRAAVLTQHGEPLQIRELPVPQNLEPNARLVRIEAATVCGSDLHLWDGSLGGSQATEDAMVAKLPRAARHTVSRPSDRRSFRDCGRRPSAGGRARGYRA